MSLATLKSYYDTHGKEETVTLLKKYTVITEKINGHRVYCRKEKSGNILFYSKKKSTPITLLDRIVSNLYEPFIGHIIKHKDKLQVGEYAFYLIKEPNICILLTDVPERASKNFVETAISINCFYQSPIFQGILPDNLVDEIIKYLESNTKDSILPMLETYIGKKCSMFGITEGFVFNFQDDGTYKLDDRSFVKKEYPKTNTATYELMLIEIFDFIKSQDFSTVKFTTKNPFMKKAEFAFEMFNRYVAFHEKHLENFLLEPPTFLQSKGKLNRRYISNIRTLELLKDSKLEYLLQVFLIALKDIQRARGIITTDIAEEHNYVILKVNEYIQKSDKLLDYNEFRKFSSESI